MLDRKQFVQTVLKFKERIKIEYETMGCRDDFLFGISVASAMYVSEPALQHYDTSLLSPHHEAKQKVKENIWEMHFADNGRLAIIIVI